MESHCMNKCHYKDVIYLSNNFYVFFCSSCILYSNYCIFSTTIFKYTNKLLIKNYLKKYVKQLSAFSQNFEVNCHEDGMVISKTSRYNIFNESF